SLIDRLQLSLTDRLPVLLQAEAAECGLTCLAMIMQFHGRKVSLNKLRRDYAISLRGSTLKSIMDIASELQLHSRALKLEVGDLDRLQCP
ncbi:cysteine peptidase family C39 domain-containing protein, partial [Acinetobacter baumannii]